jgi:RNA polymerase sigma-70 factor (ECF subfamily)
MRARKPPVAAKRDQQSPGVTEALTALPLDQREILLLVVLEGFSYAEVADALGLPRAAIGARVARARTVLEERLDASRLVERRGKPRTPPHLRLVK